jgi:quercetin dioxygenase-like cupin family protein
MTSVWLPAMKRSSTRRAGKGAGVHAVAPDEVELSGAWVEGDPTARWESASLSGEGTGAAASGASLLAIARGCRLPRHTDSAEEVVVVLEGEAELLVGEGRSRGPAGGLAVVPECEPHEIRNAGDGPLRFVAVYAAPAVTTTYDAPVQPGGDRARSATA